LHNNEGCREVRVAKAAHKERSHIITLLRAASKLVCGDEKRKVVEFKPGNGTIACLEGEGGDWVITFMWRQDHTPG
jgi:hypothetical protein